MSGSPVTPVPSGVNARHLSSPHRRGAAAHVDRCPVSLKVDQSHRRLTAAVWSQRSVIETSRWQPGGVYDFTEQGLRDAIAAAESPAWSVRAAAGRRLAATPQIEGVADVLHRLLLDA